MAIPKTNRPGLESIRTHMNRADRISQPYMAYLRIGALEMERSRRLKEKRNIMLQLEKLERRLESIDREKEMLRHLAENKPIARGQPQYCSEKELDQAFKKTTESQFEKEKVTERNVVVEEPSNDKVPLSNNGFRIRY